MTNTRDCTAAEAGMIQAIFDQIADDLSMLVDRKLAFGPPTSVHQDERPAGAGSVHISFRLGFKTERATQHGFLLLPLADGISLAACLLEVPEADILSMRELDTLDSAGKDAMAEIGNVVGGSASNALRELGVEGVQVRFTGCQGVRDGIRPALIYVEGMPLFVGTSTGTLAPFPEFTATLAIPDLALEIAAAEVETAADVPDAA